MNQPEALRLADELERDKWHVPAVVMQAAADELRRLHAQRDALLEALRLVQVDCQYLHHEKEDQHALSQPCPVVDRINAAIKAVEGEKA